MKYQKFIKISIVAFGVVGSVLLFLPERWSHTVYHPSYLGVMFLFSAALIYLPKIITKSKSQAAKDVARKTQAALAAMFILNGLGELGLYQLYLVGFEYDKMAHMATSLLAAVMLGEILIVWKKISFRQTIWRVALIIFAAGIGWELWEILSDILFHTQEWGVYGKFTNTDTVGDLTWGGIGLFFGLVFLKVTQKQKNFAV